MELYQFLDRHRHSVNHATFGLTSIEEEIVPLRSSDKICGVLTEDHLATSYSDLAH
jgi:hypothetical protein